MIDTDALRSKIIDLAIQGKLTEQMPTDGSAEDLYQQIQSEKAQLIKDKKIKKEKSLPEITEDEIPFVIPSTWKWVRLWDIGNIQTGTTPSKSHPEFFGDYIPFVSPGDMTADTIQTVKQGLSKDGSQQGRIVEGKSVLQVCIGGSIGKTAICETPITFNQQINSITPYLVSERFIYDVLVSSYFYKKVQEKSTGAATPIINKSSWGDILFPLPPLSEQKRIVAKIDEVLAEIKIIDELQSQYAYNVDVLKSKIIDAGIRGQLTEQLPEDGTAEELYKAIQTEKAQLIKDKIIKKEKPLPEITADEIPFDVPDNWKWVRIGDVVKYSLGGGTPGKNISEYWKGGDIPWASVKDFSAAEAGYLNDTIDHITQDGLNNSASNMVDENAIVICMRMALGKAVRFLRPMAINQDLRAIWLHDCVDQSYFMYMYSTIKVEGRGTTVAGIRKDELMSFLFPLPPLSEQKRIVAKIDEVFGALDARDRL